jgi:5,10-methylenetetrahydromethanopterin reductase
MEFGISVATSADSWKLAERAESLGMSHVWFYDTQMLSADCFVAMGAAAMKTERVRLGTGVLIPSNRIAPVAANAFATLNSLAPGRIDFGVGTGFTGRRAMGQDAIKLAEMEEYIRVVYALIAGETVETEMEGKNQKIRFLNPEVGLINTDDPIDLHVSAYGPRSRKLVAKLGAGWLTFISDVSGAVAWLDDMRASWAEAGRDAAGLTADAFTLGCVLEDGEPYDSPRAMAQAGPRACVILHRAADEARAGLPAFSPVPKAAEAAAAAYVEVAKTFEPADAQYLNNHRGHLLFIKPEERQFVTPELIRDTTFTATEADLKKRIGDLRDAGYTRFSIQITHGHEDAIEDWGRIFKSLA